ncbi:DUF1003 domain-containing protein [Candidatus Woesearchaeota archaeon]|nr:DUF1003 domain-containing protein [Candidatus Woesearchaeota archaeon]
MAKVGDSNNIKKTNLNLKGASQYHHFISHDYGLGNRGDIGSRVRNHPVISQKRTFGQRSADKLAQLAGSWAFIFIFLCTMVIWMAVNAFFLASKAFDPYPFILLNLALSCLAALQAPVILMSQNRQAERDRNFARYDHYVNFKAEREIQDMQKDLDEIKELIRKKWS